MPRRPKNPFTPKQLRIIDALATDTYIWHATSLMPLFPGSTAAAISRAMYNQRGVYDLKKITPSVQEEFEHYRALVNSLFVNGVFTVTPGNRGSRAILKEVMGYDEVPWFEASELKPPIMFNGPLMPSDLFGSVLPYMPIKPVVGGVVIPVPHT